MASFLKVIALDQIMTKQTPTVCLPAVRGLHSQLGDSPTQESQRLAGEVTFDVRYQYLFSYCDSFNVLIAHQAHDLKVIFILY